MLLNSKTVAGLTLAAAFALSACENSHISDTPQARPQTPIGVPSTQPPTEAMAPQISSRSAASLEASRYYASVQAALLNNDLLRTNTGGVDTPFTVEQLAANFDAIALNEEYQAVGGAYIASTAPSSLRRWNGPVRIGLEFGASVPEGQRAKDRATVAKLTPRLARATRHSIVQSPVSNARTNFHVLVLNEDERTNIGPRLDQLIPGINQTAIDTVENMPKSAYCLVFAFDAADNGAYTQAVAVVRGEHPDLMRRSCLHEEIAQGLGLANDSPRARPSIFNDDEEFALLTQHDELLLRILYDERLRPGMSPEVARHFSAQIAREVMTRTN